MYSNGTAVDKSELQIGDAVDVYKRQVLGCLRALRLVNTLGPAGELTDESVAEAGGFYRFSAKALAAIVLVNMCADLAKLLLIDLSSNSSVNVSLPILPLL